MRRAILVVLLLVGYAVADEKPPLLRGEADTAQRKIVLLELYTSQG